MAMRLQKKSVVISGYKQGSRFDLAPWNPCPETQQRADTNVADDENLASERGPSNATENSRELRNSSHRKVWSTLFDFQDWPTYVFIAIVLFVCLSVARLRLQDYESIRNSLQQ